jgi:hypothetical protein
MRSVMHANGPRPLTFCASATSISGPQRHDAVTQLDPPREPAQRIAIRRHRTDLDTTSLVVEQTVIQRLARQIRTGVHHEHGPSSSWLPSVTRRSVPPREALLQDIQ